MFGVGLLEQVPQDEGVNVDGSDRRRWQETADLREEHWRVRIGGVRSPPVRSPHQRGIEGDYVQQRPETKVASNELPADAHRRNPNRRIKEQLYGVVAGLSMNFHGARKIWRVPIVEPVVVREP